MCFQFWGLAILLLAVTSPAQTAIPAASLPLWFEANHGQAGMTAPFAAHGPDSAFFITATNAQFVLRKPSGETAATCMRFIGANSAAQIAGQAEMPGKVNYLIGNDPAQWRSGIPVFAKVRVDNLYSGVNVVYYGNGRQLEYDFDLAAGVDPQTIAIRFDGAENISVNPEGELVVSLNSGEVIQHRPMVYQETGLTRHEINGGYKILNAHTATFALADYDHNLPLVIDPILSYSTYLGGNKGAIIHAVALGNPAANEIYVAGETLSTSFPNAPTNGFQASYQGTGPGNVGDAFIAKFGNVGTNVLGTNFIYFTYLGGSADEAAYGLAVDNVGHAYVTGATTSGNFPTKNPIYSHPTTNGFRYTTDAFVTELETNGASLIYSTYLVGNASDIGTAITVDSNYNTYVAGYTYSTNFPTRPGAYQNSLQCTNNLFFNANGFLVEIASNGNALTYSSYFGGNNFDKATAIALDQSDNIYVAGYTASTNFPVANWWTNNVHLNNPTNYNSVFDAFVAKFSPNFANLAYSTYLGGTNDDRANGIAVDASGNAYVVGSTASPNFTNMPPAGLNLASCVLTNTASVAAATNAFLTQINWNGTNANVGYSTVFGGVGNDVANGVTVNSAGQIFIVGSASSTNFPVTPPNLAGSLRATNSASSPTQTSDAFVMAVGANSNLLYSAYLGGSGDDLGNAIAADSSGNAYVAGQTASANFPVFNAWQTNFTGTYYDGFLAKVLPASPSPLEATLNGTNVLVSWQPTGQESVAYIALQSNTNLLSTNWTVVTTNLPAPTNGTYLFSLPHTNPAQFFRLHLY